MSWSSATVSETLPGRRFLFSLDADWFPGSHTGLSRVYEFCERYKLRTTVFFTGRFAETYPELVREAAIRGYDLGTHGWEHGLDREEDFRRGSYEQQRRWIDLSTEAVEKASGVTPVAFRAPNLSIGEMTFRVLEERGYRFDSSIPARRFDCGYGQVSHPRHFFAPLRPYHPAADDLASEGGGRILEIPPSAFWIPLNMSALRVLGLAALKWAANRIAQRSPLLVFYAHPVEFEYPEKQTIPSGQPARYRNGLGPHNLDLLAEFVEYVLRRGYVSESLAGAAKSVGGG